MLCVGCALIAGACGTRRSTQDVAEGSMVPFASGADTSAAAEASGALDSTSITDSAGQPSASEQRGTAGIGEGHPSTGPADRLAAGGREAIVLGSVGTYSGIAGSVFAEAPKAVQAWARSLNDRGGLGGRPVVVRVYDDGGDTARHKALTQQAVEGDHVVAFIASHAALTGASAIEYLNKVRVPTIGGSATDAWFTTSAMHFHVTAVGSDANFLYAAATFEMGKQSGFNKVGIVYCVEASSCSQFSKDTEDSARKLGMDVVWNQSVSIAQPDFTGECLSARNAGVQVMLVGLDGNSLHRIAGACARQGFHLRFFQPMEGVEMNMRDDVNLDGLITGAPVFPVTLGGNPAADAVKNDIDAYLGPVDNFMLVSQAWFSAKAFEEAVGFIDGDVTSRSVLNGLYQIRDEDFNGLTAPITYTPTSKNPPVCFTLVELTKGNFVLPDGGVRHCQKRL